jgi:zinc-finger of transposase IS204/IS1001/IS1096/IS1165
VTKWRARFLEARLEGLYDEPRPRGTAKGNTPQILGHGWRAEPLPWENLRMQDHELYRRILGIEAPWQVQRVELKLNEGEVHVYLGHADNLEWRCAECGALGPLYDHQPERQWRHLDTCQYRRSTTSSFMSVRT